MEDWWGIATAMSTAISVKMDTLEEQREELRKLVLADSEPESLTPRHISRGQA